MSAIVPLIALATTLFALVILVIALVHHTPRSADLTDMSVWLYRLLLAAYPAPFREEYGDAMTQLFRDTARDAVRRRGVFGLSALWLRTLVDFTISVIRQHRDKPAPVSSESALLYDLWQKWRRLGTEALSVSAFSLWYGWHVLRLYFQRAVLVWATLTAIAFGIWVTSFFDSISGIQGRATAIGIVRGGAVLIWHGYEEGGPISDEQWQRDCREWVKRNPSLPGQLSSPVRPWEFSFLSGIPGAVTIKHGPDRKPVLVQPYKAWRVRFPFGIFPVLLLGWTIHVYLRRKSHSVAVIQST